MASFGIGILSHQRLHFVLVRPLCERRKIVLVSPFVRIHSAFDSRRGGLAVWMRAALLCERPTNARRQIRMYEAQCKCAVKHNLHVSCSGNHLLCIFSLSSLHPHPFLLLFSSPLPPAAPSPARHLTTQFSHESTVLTRFAPQKAHNGKWRGEMGRHAPGWGSGTEIRKSIIFK